jgi:DNA-binding response OmpR family regulator
MRVLIVEDDAELQGALERRLRGSGFAVDVASDLPEAELAIDVNSYDCLVLDRAVPSGDTIDLVRHLRRQGTTTPALFLNAKDAVSQRVDGFEAGGDDYLVKPFAMEELIVRVRRLARRSVDETPTLLAVADLTVDQARAEVRRDNVPLLLTAKELAVLVELASRPGVVVSRTHLIDTCWDELTDPMSNTVDVHIASLRRKLGEPTLIHTVAMAIALGILVVIVVRVDADLRESAMSEALLSKAQQAASSAVFTDDGEIVIDRFLENEELTEDGPRRGCSSVAARRYMPSPGQSTTGTKPSWIGTPGRCCSTLWSGWSRWASWKRELRYSPAA